MTVPDVLAAQADDALGGGPLMIERVRLAGMLICPECSADSLYAFGLFRDETTIDGRLLPCQNRDCRAVVKAGEVMSPATAGDGRG